MSVIIEAQAPSSNDKIIELKFHPLVRIAHWANVFTVLALTLSGLSIYWASPVIKISGVNGPEDIFTLIGKAALTVFPEPQESARNWFFDHFALGAGNLAYALNIHWLFAYIFMGVAVCYALGSLLGGGYRAVLPRQGDIQEAIVMAKFYLTVIPNLLKKKPLQHLVVKTKYNALQRFAYFSVSVCSFISIATGWAIHKPSQLGWLQALCGGYDFARILHFLMLVFFASFVIPHVALVGITGWDCFRSMVVGYSEKPGDDHG